MFSTAALALQPRIDAVSPSQGPIAGGTIVTMFVSENQSRIRRIDGHGTITSYGTMPSTKLRADAAGSLFGVGNDQVFRLDRHGSLTTLAGGVNHGFSGDGGPAPLAAPSSFGQSEGVAIDRDGNLFFVDAGNYRVRAIRYGALLAPPNATIQASASGSTIRATVFGDGGRLAPSVRVDFTAPTSGRPAISRTTATISV